MRDIGIPPTSYLSYKDNAISMLRFISMLMIIACHICQHYEIELAFWFNVGVQVFFMISGFLYGQKDINNPFAWFWKQFKKIAVQYYLFVMLITILLILFHRDVLNLYDLATSILFIGTIKGFGYLWFVGYILFCYLITPILQYSCQTMMSVNRYKLLLLLLGIVCVYQLYASLLNLYFMPARVLCYVAGYIIGYAYYRKGLPVINRSTLLFLVLGISSNALYIYLRYVLARDISGLSILYSYSHLFLGGMIFLIGYKLFSHTRDNVLLAFSDHYSYAIYIVHGTFALSTFNVLDIQIPMPARIILVFLLSISFGIGLKMAEKIVLRIFSYAR